MANHGSITAILFAGEITVNESVVETKRFVSHAAVRTSAKVAINFASILKLWLTAYHLQFNLISTRLFILIN